jgi:uncharacterized membrane protein
MKYQEKKIYFNTWAAIYFVLFGLIAFLSEIRLIFANIIAAVTALFVMIIVKHMLGHRIRRWAEDFD